jgi:hypothetical protein
MKKLAFLAVAACALGATPLAPRLGVVSGSLALVLLGMLLATAASGALQALALASGAIGAFASTLALPVSPALSGALLIALVLAERTTRIRSRRARILHVSLALATGAVAGALVSSFVLASPAVRGVSLVVAAVLVALPLLIEADDPIAHALDAAALGVAEPARAKLHEGAALRRNASDVMIDRAAMRQVQSTWRSLLGLADARVRMEGRVAAPSSPTESVRRMLDNRIAEHVAALARALTAVDAASAARLGLDDAARRNVDAVGESLESLSEAMMETK